MRVHRRQLLCRCHTCFLLRRSRAKPEQSCCSFRAIRSIFRLIDNYSISCQYGRVHPQITAYFGMKKPTAADYIREYLVRMAEIRGTGGATKETSYYSALENILNHFGKELRPPVICNGQLKYQGAGNPDFGLYTKAQIQGGEPTPGQI